MIFSLSVQCAQVTLLEWSGAHPTCHAHTSGAGSAACAAVGGEEAEELCVADTAGSE